MGRYLERPLSSVSAPCGELGKRHFIGLAGGSASGKTTVATRIIESLGVPWVSVLSMDSFYKVGWHIHRTHKNVSRQ